VIDIDTDYSIMQVISMNAEGLAMEHFQLDQLCKWFEEYVLEFYTGEDEFDRNIRLKVEHTRKVYELMSAVAEGEGFSPQDVCISKAVALLHDVGRFPQYQRWRTFRDRDSDNHARMSVDVIREHKLLEQLTTDQQLLVEEAVRFHNLLHIPSRLRSGTDRYLRLIRDADKLDIWRVFVEYFDAPPEHRASAAMLGFPEKDGVSADCLAALERRCIVNLNSVNSVNDFRLLLISWVYDLNFRTTYQLLQQTGLIKRLLCGLPDDPSVRHAVASAEDYVLEKSAAVYA
jgi:hypothetical protein